MADTPFSFFDDQIGKDCFPSGSRLFVRRLFAPDLLRMHKPFNQIHHHDQDQAGQDRSRPEGSKRRIHNVQNPQF